MLEACPVGSTVCRVRGGSFCVTHEPHDPVVKRLLAAGEVVRDLDGRPLLWPPLNADVQEGS